MSKLPFSHNDLQLIIKSGTKFFIYFCIASSVSIVKAETSPTNSGKSLTKKVSQLFKPQPDESYRSVDFQKLSNLRFDQKQFQRLGNDKNYLPTSTAMWNKQISLIDAIQYAVQRNPSVSQAISTLAGQNAGIDYAKAGYYPQISGGITTGDLSSGERGRQLLTLSATQMLYDFGKVKSGVSVEKAKLQVEQANVLVSIDDIALDVAQTIVNIQRYLQLNKIAEQQIAGIQRIQEIANLRANAGISSQADPIQAQTYLESAQSTLIAQQSLLRKYQQHLRTLIGVDVFNKSWIIPDDLVKQSDLYGEPEFNTIPKMIAAQAGVEVAKAQKQQTRLTRYPTLAVKGSVSQAINGK
ncbi:TolC family protein, partial [Acinetobacter baumannii]|uniref:TolC family protein n=1 Tax=Acinetobacter baumannii TaxID=470 RepID=UPI0024DEE1A1